MNKLIYLATALLLTITVAAQPKTIYVNSKTTTCKYYGKTQECLQYKLQQSDTAWQVYQGGSIRGFTYNPGYFYTLQVRQLQSNRQQWSLVKVVSKTKSTIQQQTSDTIATAKPPALLIGQWNFTRLLDSTEEINMSAGKEMLQFDATQLRITGKASCNSFFGNYTVDSTNTIKFEAIGHTMMACEALATENRMLKAMEMVTSWSVTGNKLYLKAEGKTLIELTKVEGGKI
jgi:heat shock protein HslJ